jgi:hypothetical protein
VRAVTGGLPRATGRSLWVCPVKICSLQMLAKSRRSSETASLRCVCEQLTAHAASVLHHIGRHVCPDVQTCITPGSDQCPSAQHSITPRTEQLQITRMHAAAYGWVDLSRWRYLPRFGQGICSCE